MSVWLWVLLIVIGLIAAVSLCNVQARLTVIRRNENDRIAMKIRWLYGLVHLQYTVPQLKFKGFNKGLVVKQKEMTMGAGIGNDADVSKNKITKESIERSYRKYKDLLEHTFEFSRWLKGILSHIRCTQLIWGTRIGAGEAVETAMLTGVVWSAKGSLVGLGSRYIRLQTQPQLEVIPLYNRVLFSTELNCIFKFRTGYAIIAGFLLLVRILRIKGGMKTWRNILFKAS